MNANNKLLFILILLIGLAFFQAVYFYPNLPQRVATHFNFRGEADNFSSKKNAVTVNFVLFAILSGFFYGLTRILKKIPDNFINLPNKEYWLNKQNREKSLDVIANFVMKLGIVTQIFLLYIFQHAYKINVANNQSINIKYFWIGLAVYLLYVINSTWQLYQFFNRIDRTNGLQN